MSEIRLRKRVKSTEDETTDSRDDSCLTKTKLDSYPHLLCNIFTTLSLTTLLEAEKVSPLWKQLIASPIIWQRQWESMENASSVMKTLAARLKHVEPKLFERIQKEDVSSYRSACESVEQNVREIQKLDAQTHTIHKLMNLRRCLVFRADENNLYLGSCLNRISIINRWTKEFVGEFILDSEVYDMRLNDRHLVARLMNFHTVVFDLKTFSLIQKIKDEMVDQLVKISHFSGVYLEHDLLINWGVTQNLRYFVTCIRRVNPSTGLFGPAIEKIINIDTLSEVSDGNVYCTENLLIMDMDCECGKRIITLIDINSLTTVAQRTFDSSLESRIKKECVNDVIIVEWFPNPNRYQFGLLAWNVKEDTFRPISVTPRIANKTLFSASVTHHPNYQFFLHKNGREMVRMYVVSAKDWRCGGNSIAYETTSKMLNFKLSSQDTYRDKKTFFDGVQLITLNDGKLNFIEFVN